MRTQTKLMRKDFLGNEIKVGAWVAFESSANCYPSEYGMILGKVIKENPATWKVERLSVTYAKTWPTPSNFRKFPKINITTTTKNSDKLVVVKDPPRFAEVMFEKARTNELSDREKKKIEQWVRFGTYD